MMQILITQLFNTRNAIDDGSKVKHVVYILQQKLDIIGTVIFNLKNYHNRVKERMIEMSKTGIPENLEKFIFEGFSNH